ncbi:MAG TPA: NADPH-dependent FMN reductase [Candidatus Dormibacteraeota bacterium]|nr:NADPH-dependent FMN reductase [Candidatus Dormibacteraeota bacterium]
MVSPLASFRILGISGSLRKGSYNTALLRVAQRLVPDGVELRIYDGLGEVPLYNEDVRAQGEPEPVQRLRRAILEADAVLIATPEYNWSVPGVLQNAIDWVSRPAGQGAFRGKPVAIMGASTSIAGTLRAQLQLRQVLRSVDAFTVPKPEVIVTQASNRFDAEGNLTDETARELIVTLLKSLVAWAHRLNPERALVESR